uniref:Uncharacterized protein n=1 Tax=Paramormyrops kingsleyae TaxID=1676925 RepID=A0A3B3R5P3_9TELE
MSLLGLALWPQTPSELVFVEGIGSDLRLAGGIYLLGKCISSTYFNSSLSRRLLFAMFSQLDRAFMLVWQGSTSANLSAMLFISTFIFLETYPTP